MNRPILIAPVRQQRESISIGNRAAEIIDGIRSFYKKSPPQRELVDVNEIVEEMLTLLER
jgi:C4-dicarboxylate-specific signal transduction histidine kinase